MVSQDRLSLSYLVSQVERFKGGNICGKSKWLSITKDKYILDIVHKGLKLNFLSIPPSKGPFEYPRQAKERDIIDKEVMKLLHKQVIEPCLSNSDSGEYFSNLFIAPKKDGTYRTILNLKPLNVECDSPHFKMESLKQALHLVRRGSYMASIDIKDAFYSVPIQKDHKKYLRFMWKGQQFQFRVMPNGYCDAMRVFTKLLKPAFAKLREEGHESVIFVDDSFLLGDTFDECLRNISATIYLLQELGFVIHPDKSILVPTQKLTFLGFVIDTMCMTVTLTEEKKKKIVDMGKGLLERHHITIRMISSFIGNLTASMEAVPFGKLYYRNIEWAKTSSLKENKFNFEAPCTLTKKALKEIKWWVDNISDSCASIRDIPDVDLVIHTDASKENGGGWGASDGRHPDINGRWSIQEQGLHINILELMAIKLGLRSYVPLYENCKHVRIMSDNTTAIAYVNKLGGTHCMTMNELAVEIWEFCRVKGVHLSAAHIPGIQNTLADVASRKFQDSIEWALPKNIFNEIVGEFGMPDIDMFASRLNHQVPIYASWLPDPESAFIDAMSVNWGKYYLYAFPPFSMIWPMIQKINKEKVRKALLILPKWPTQSWYPIIGKMRIPHTREFIYDSNQLQLHGTMRKHPLAKLKLQAVLCRSLYLQQQSH